MTDVADCAGPFDNLTAYPASVILSSVRNRAIGDTLSVLSPNE